MKTDFITTLSVIRQTNGHVDYWSVYQLTRHILRNRFWQIKVTFSCVPDMIKQNSGVAGLNDSQSKMH